MQLRTFSKEIENEAPVLELRFATAQAPNSEANLGLVLEAIMAVALLLGRIVCGWHGFGKRLAPRVQVPRRCHAVGAAETHYRLPQRPSRSSLAAVPSYQGKQAHLRSRLLSGVGLGLAKHGGEVARPCVYSAYTVRVDSRARPGAADPARRVAAGSFFVFFWGFP